MTMETKGVTFRVDVGRDGGKVAPKCKVDVVTDLSVTAV